MPYEDEYLDAAYEDRFEMNDFPEPEDEPFPEEMYDDDDYDRGDELDDDGPFEDDDFDDEPFDDDLERQELEDFEGLNGPFEMYDEPGDW